MQKVVINSSPLIVLFKSKLINILPQVCQEIIILNAVWSEVTAYSLEKQFIQETEIRKKGFKKLNRNEFNLT